MPLTSKSLENEFWAGYCPECLVTESEMCMNSNGQWECPKCNLLIQTIETITVLPYTGTGHFMKNRNGSVLAVCSTMPTETGRITHDLRG